MIDIHKAASRYTADHGWLKSSFSFSFADYYDPDNMGFGPLRVFNDDAVAPQTGFGSHPHREMEIVSIVLEGQLGHRDSTGRQEVIRPGEVQRMSAGTGIVHSEMNPSATEPVSFYSCGLSRPNTVSRLLTNKSPTIRPSWRTSCFRSYRQKAGSKSQRSTRT